jgi:D-glycero-D-manno-heptose 1,7-bisphosphate phosphatase
MLKPAIFLDRDGTLNRQIVREGKPYPPSRLEEFVLLPGVIDACAVLRDAGYELVVATNQPDVGRGDQSVDVVESMHAQLLKWIPQISRIEVCYDPGKGIESLRRKPAPGMLLDAACSCSLDLARSWMIGDRWRDITCGKRAGVRTILIDYNYMELLPDRPDFTVKNLLEAAQIILGSHSITPKQ